MAKASKKSENSKQQTVNSKSAKDEVIVEQTASDERSTQAEATGDPSLDDVLYAPGAGASDAEIDVESLAGEDKSVEESVAEKYAEEIEAEAGSSDTAEQAADLEEEKPAALPEPKPKKTTKATKKEHIQGPRKDPRSKKYRGAIKDLDLATLYTPDEAIALVKKTSYTSFDGTVEAHIHLTLTNQRGVITLPAGTGRARKVAAVTAANVEDMVKAIEAGTLDFDVLLATPDVMAKLSKVARILGPKGLMPNPKSGTVTTDVEKAKEEFNSGRIEFKQDKGGVVHQAIGKVSFSDEQLMDNFKALQHAMPQGKVASITLTATMGPGIKVKI